MINFVLTNRISCLNYCIICIIYEMESLSLYSDKIGKSFVRKTIESLTDLCVVYLVNNSGDHQIQSKMKNFQLTEDVKSLIFTYLQKRCRILDEEIELFLPSGLRILSMGVSVYDLILITFARNVYISLMNRYNIYQLIQGIQ